MRNIQVIPKSNKENLRKYFNDYLIELSEFDPHIKFDPNGTPIYKWFDCYFTDYGRYPFYLIIDGKMAGFCMIREVDNNHYEIGEFCVLKEFRGNDNALWFAKECTDLFDGKIDFSTRHSNIRAIKFWTKFAKLYNLNYTDDIENRYWVLVK